MAVHAEMLSFSIAAGAPDAAASLPPGPGAGERRAAGGREEQPVAAPAEMRYFRERDRESEPRSKALLLKQMSSGLK
jgi:hypothetical protein